MDSTVVTSERIAGIDEAGRGALAGPVVAGAVILPNILTKRRSHIPCWSPYVRRPADADCLIADSKMLSPEQRDVAYTWIVEHCAFGVGIVDNVAIDTHGILRATEQAMQLALDELRTNIQPTSLLIDGRDAFHFDCPHTSVIRGDSIHPCIAAGSIIAKVTRDRLMKEWHHTYPDYLFHEHKGYGAEVHRLRIMKHGPCPLHRRSFLRNILNEQLSLLMA